MNWSVLFGLLARELHLTPHAVGEMEWWEVEDVFADMRERPSVQAMVQGYLGIKSPRKATASEAMKRLGQRG